MTQTQLRTEATRSQVSKLEEAMALANKMQDKMPPPVYGAMVAGIRSQMEELKQELQGIRQTTATARR